MFTQKVNTDLDNKAIFLGKERDGRNHVFKNQIFHNVTYTNRYVTYTIQQNFIF